jgi:limonene-1,2-epoxide hydrolase
MSTSAEKVVRDFCAAWSRKSIDELLGFFAPDAVYHNMPMQPVQGAEAIRAVFEQFVAPADAVQFELLHLAASGDVVHTERVDRFRFGDKTVALPVAGVFEIRAGKIAAWRDYFDMQDFMRQSGAE